METTIQKQETAFGYTRISQEDRNSPTLTLDNQNLAIQDFCLRNNIKLLKIFNEGEHTGDRNRPVFNNVVQIAYKLKPTYIIVRDRTRFARDQAFLIDTIDNLKTQGIKSLTIVEGDISSNMMVTGIFGAVDEELIRKGKWFVKNMMETKEKNGIGFGTLLYGYKSAKDKSWELDKEKSDKVKTMFNDFAQNDLSLTDMAHQYGFKRTTIYKMLKNEKYCGRFSYLEKIRDKNKKIIKVIKHEYIMKGESIISVKLFNIVQKKLSRRFNNDSEITML